MNSLFADVIFLFSTVGLITFYVALLQIACSVKMYLVFRGMYSASLKSLFAQ